MTDDNCEKCEWTYVAGKYALVIQLFGLVFQTMCNPDDPKYPRVIETGIPNHIFNLA